MDMLVLAGGFGTRLKSVVSDVPKPLAPVNNIPFLHYQLNNWIAQGVDSFTFLLHSQSDLIINYLAEFKSKIGKHVEIRWLVEDVPLDTGGAVSNAVEYFGLSNNFLMTNGDTWLGDGCLKVFDKTKSSIAIVKVPDVSRYGSVVTHSGLVTGFREKSALSGSGWINAGLACFSPEVFHNWDKKAFSLEKVTLPKLAIEGSLYAVELDTEFIDIGIPADYHKFCELVESKKSLI